MTEHQPAGPETVTEDELAEALDGFWLYVACGGQRIHGQVADPGEVASVLLATLGRIAAESEDPETPLSDAEHRLGQVRENAESLLLNPDPVVRWCARQVLAVLGVPVPPLPPARAGAVADLVAVEGAAAVLERRYPGARPERLDTVLSELHAVVRAWRRMAAEAGDRSDEEGPADD